MALWSPPRPLETALATGLTGIPQYSNLFPRLAPNLVQSIFAVIRDINARGVTILLAEQNAHMALRTAHRGYVMETGRIVLQDTAANLAANPQVKEAYLGE